VADFAVVVATAIVETGFAHAALHGARERQHPPARLRWQLSLGAVRSTFRTRVVGPAMSAHRAKADIPPQGRDFRF
jgi:hypothetical protein